MSDDDWQLDATLLARWREGDQRAGEQLYERHVDAVIRSFRNKLREDPQDLVQETFMRLVAARERIADGQAMRAYVLMIARHVLSEHLRQRRLPLDLDIDVDAVEDVLPGPSTIAAKRHEHRVLLEALRRIPISQQILLELYYWERLDTNELAQIMDISPSALRSRLVRARELLGKAMFALEDSAELRPSTHTQIDDWAEQIRRVHLPDKHD